MEGLAKSGYRNQITVQKFNHPSMFFWLYTQKIWWFLLIFPLNFWRLKTSAPKWLT